MTGLHCYVVPGATCAPASASEWWDLFARQVGSDAALKPFLLPCFLLPLGLLIVAGWVLREADSGEV